MIAGRELIRTPKTIVAVIDLSHRRSTVYMGAPVMKIECNKKERTQRTLPLFHATSTDTVIIPHVRCSNIASMLTTTSQDCHVFDCHHISRHRLQLQKYKHNKASTSH